MVICLIRRLEQGFSLDDTLGRYYFLLFQNPSESIAGFWDQIDTLHWKEEPVIIRWPNGTLVMLMGEPPNLCRI